MLLGNIYRTFKVHQNPIIMTKVIITANVEDSAKWEAGFRSHADMFRGMSLSKTIQFSANDNNDLPFASNPMI